MLPVMVVVKKIFDFSIFEIFSHAGAD